MARARSASLSLRPCTPEDLPFLSALYAETRAGEMAATRWSAEMQAAFLQGQFEAQHRSYRQQFPEGSFDVVLAAGRPVGRLYVVRLPGEVRVVEITLGSAWQGRGWGTELLKKVLAQADRAGLPVRLRVDANNRARRLYQRLGFQGTAQDGVYLHLERPVGGKARAERVDKG